MTLGENSAPNKKLKKLSDMIQENPLGNCFSEDVIKPVSLNVMLYYGNHE